MTREKKGCLDSDAGKITGKIMKQVVATAQVLRVWL